MDEGREMETEAEGSASRILAAAAEILADEGYEALSMRKVAARVGLSQAAIYRHYRDKAELMASVIGAGYARLAGKLEGGEQLGGRPEAILAEGIRRYVDFALDSPRLFRAILLQDLGPAGKGIEAFAPGVSRRRRTFELLSSTIARGMAGGSFSPGDPELTAQAVWAAMFGLAARLSLESGLDRGRIEALREREIEIILRGLSAGQGEKA
jgi:AcrR family transcriptional regulator